MRTAWILAVLRALAVLGICAAVLALVLSGDPAHFITLAAFIVSYLAVSVANLPALRTTSKGEPENAGPYH